jgi:hypothetical protein
VYGGLIMFLFITNYIMTDELNVEVTPEVTEEIVSDEVVAEAIEVA